jgi:prepilin-type processing-associated H-X9-DG protein
VELLVVIGIIAILVGILLPALGKARREAQGAACLSNLRQLSNAVIMYASENNEFMPCRAGTSNLAWTGPGSVASGTYPTNNPLLPGGYDDTSYTANWIAWYRQTDPITGQASGAAKGGQDQNITYSALAKYLAIPFTLSSSTGYNGLPVSNTISDSYDHVFICPGDDRSSRSGYSVSATNVYRYSYSLNDWVALASLPNIKAPIALPTGMAQNTRVWGTFNGKLTSIKQPSNIVLFICEDSATIDDGVAKFDASQWANGRINTVSPRHTSGARSANAIVATGAGANQDGYGNASFCDGHAEIVSRKDVLRGVHSGNPVPDPAGF